MKHVSEVLRELIRRMTMGKRNAAYWQSLQNEQRRYHGIQTKPAKQPKGQRRG